MESIETLLKLSEVVGPIVLVCIVVVYLLLRAEKKPKNLDTEEGFTATQKLYLKTNVVDPIMDFLKEAKK